MKTRDLIDGLAFSSATLKKRPTFRELEERLDDLLFTYVGDCDYTASARFRSRAYLRFIEQKAEFLAILRALPSAPIDPAADSDAKDFRSTAG
jgi:hypothetical protein